MDAQSIKEAVDIVSVISSRIDVKRDGAGYKACCPFHDEKTASFKINAKHQYYKCFGCGASGDAISFVEKFDGLEFLDAVEALATTYGLEFSRKGVDPKLSKQKDALAEFFEYGRLRNDDGRKYLDSRGLYSDVGAVYFSEDVLSGRFNESVRTIGMSEKLIGYVVLPIHNRSGSIIAWAARNVDSPVEDAPKYLNMHNIPGLFNKSEVLYNMDNVSLPSQNEGFIYVTEGYMDVLAMRGAGVTNAVATCGTALTTQHAKILKRAVDRIVLMYDGDKAGIDATIKAVGIALNEGLVVDVAVMPEGKDPGDLYSFQTKYEPKILSWPDWYKQNVYDKASTTGKVAALEKVNNIMEACSNSVIKAVYVPVIKELFSIEIDSGLANLEKIGKEYESDFDTLNRYNIPHPYMLLLASVVVHREIGDMQGYRQAIVDVKGYCEDNPGTPPLFYSVVLYLERERSPWLESADEEHRDVIIDAIELANMYDNDPYRLNGYMAMNIIELEKATRWLNLARVSLKRERDHTLVSKIKAAVQWIKEMKEEMSISAKR